MKYSEYQTIHSVYLLPRLHCDRCRAGLVDAHSTNPVRHLLAFRLQLHGPEADRTKPSATTPIVSLNTRGVSLIDTRGLHVDKTRSKLCSHLPLALTSIVLGARRWAILAMDDPVISASQSSIFYLFVRKFTIVGVIFYHTIFALHGFDFRTCLQVRTAVLFAQ